MSDLISRFHRWESQSRDTIDFKRIYVHLTGDVKTGLLLSQIVYWFLPDYRGETKLTVELGGRRWLVKRREDWWEECCLSPKEYDRSAAKLVELGFIVTEVHRFHGERAIHIWLDEERLAFEVLEGGISKLTDGEFTNPRLGKMELPERGTSSSCKTTAENTHRSEPSPNGVPEPDPPTDAEAREALAILRGLHYEIRNPDSPASKALIMREVLKLRAQRGG